MDQTILRDFRHTVAEQGLGAYGVHVYKAGRGEVEHRWRSDDITCLYSASKTFTAVGVGIAVDEGRFALEDRVLDYFSSHREMAAPGTETITVRNLLQMASGKKMHWHGVQQAVAKGAAGAFFRQPMEWDAGTHFHYSNLCTYMLGRLVEKTSGQPLREYMMPRLFEPLGIINPLWQACPHGHTLAATRLYLTTGELARLGRLLLQRGLWEGRQLVSAGYVKKMAEDVISTEGHDDPEGAGGYGYQVWRCTRPGAYRADGMYGQYAIVMPELEAVVTVTAHEEHRPYDIVRAVFNDLAPLLEV